MPLEATMMIIDNSEYMRNGDYQPTRFDSQSDAVNKVFEVKTDSNPENTVGIMSMAGKGPEVLVTHTKDLGQILKAVHTTSNKIGGAIDIPTAIAIAQLALKHRENKNLRQRIIVFVASPLDGAGMDEKSMVKLAKKLKKNNVAVDIVAFGDGIEEGEKNVLKTFVETASSGDNSRLVSVPPGAHLLSDAILSSPILSGDRGIPEEAMGDVGGAGASGSGGGGGNNFEFGVDPSLDPELAMALRMSMQEAQAREAVMATTTPAGTTSESAPPPANVPPPAAAAAPPATSSTTTTATPAPPATSSPPDEEDEEEEEDDDEDDEEEALKKALAMSTESGGGDGDVEMNEDEEEEDGDEEEDEDEEMDEEEAIARAIEMSMKGEEENKK